MKKTLFFYMFSIFCVTLPALIVEVPNDQIKIEDSGNFIRIRSNAGTNYTAYPGAPEIPLKTVFFEIPLDNEIAEITIIPQDVSRIELKKRIFPQQAAVPLLSLDQRTFSEADEQIYNSTSYPQTILYNYGHGFCGDKSVGYAAIYTSEYFPRDQILEIPASFRLEIEFVASEMQNHLPASKSSNLILSELGVESTNRSEEVDSYLLITTAEFLPAYQELLSWRSSQGVNVFWITTAEIETQYAGRDLQEKIRNSIINYYQTEQISFVTLGADVDYIPDRKVFAFDCQFGAYDDENDIPSDMYYSCLQGSWDADNNDIFGEETDEVDYFPEVFVSRIPINSIEEIEDYISRLISYESGEIADYNKAAGFSMALWPGSDSEVCQQYIYDMYFPVDYDIQFMWGDENTQEAAYELMNDGQNIVQHTGHAGRQSMSLENGRIRLDDIDSLQNEWGGLFYSIGCWSAAIDYNSIGENLVSQLDRGFLGYVGNSRYGWGAPSASGFGFSEFFQKAFFRELFAGNTRLAEINALQKIEFIPYYSGTSVYKWVAYELNALGDSYLNLNISNPEEMNYSLVLESNEYHIIVSDAYGPLENVFISGSAVSVVTDMTGKAVIPAEIGESELCLFKSGYRTQFVQLPAGTDNFLLEFIHLPEELNFIQGETFSLETEFSNFTDQEQWFRLVCDYNPGEITLDCNMDTQLATAGSSVDLDDIIISLNSIADSYQMLDGKEIFLNINVFSATGNYLLSERKLSFTVAAPDLEIQQFYLDAETVLPGSQIPLELGLVNTGTDEIFGLDIEYSSESPYLEFENNSFHIDSYLMPGDGLLLNNFINVDGSAPSSLLAEFQVICRTYWQEQLYVFENSLFFTTGQIGFTDEFDHVEMWELDPEWQLVNTTYYSEQYSLSCRPEYVGCYRVESPLLNYIPGLEVLFQYKYKMPMYGNDGVYVLLETENTVDTLLFLGAGGALPETDRTPQIYIESDWAEYQLSLDDILLNTPDPGTQFSIALQFTVPEIIDGFNEYSLMQDIGVFFDDFSVGQQREKPDPPHNDVLQIYPNPSSAAGLPRFSAYSRGEYPLTMKIYDIKGRLIRQEKYEGLGNGRIELFWNGKDEWGKPAASGLYIIIIDTDVKKYRDKFIYFN